MSKLFKLKEWVTLPDAAKRLAITFGEDVTEADVLQLALDGKLQLSIYLVNAVEVRHGTLVPFAEATFREYSTIEGGLLRHYGTQVDLGDGAIQVLETEQVVSTLSGVRGLPIVSTARLEVERLHHRLIGAPVGTQVAADGILIEVGDGRLCQLLSRFDERERVERFWASLHEVEKHIADNKLGFDDALNLTREFHKNRTAPQYVAGNKFPKDSLLVMRTDALLAFERSQTEPTSPLEKPLNSRERDTLLTIIALVCKEAKLDYTKAAKTAGMIRSTADSMGVSIGESTIEGHLKLIPEALSGKSR